MLYNVLRNENNQTIRELSGVTKGMVHEALTDMINSTEYATIEDGKLSKFEDYKNVDSRFQVSSQGNDFYLNLHAEKVMLRLLLTEGYSHHMPISADKGHYKNGLGMLTYQDEIFQELRKVLNQGPIQEKPLESQKHRLQTLANYFGNEKNAEHTFKMALNQIQTTQ